MAVPFFMRTPEPPHFSPIPPSSPPCLSQGPVEHVGHGMVGSHLAPVLIVHLMGSWQSWVMMHSIDIYWIILVYLGNVICVRVIYIYILIYIIYLCVYMENINPI
jgi:hypothetical protein